MTEPINIHVVVMAGGSGTRFWPVSRRAHPKQLLAIGGEGTLLARTFERVEELVPAERWWVVVGRSHAEACIEAVPRVPRPQVLVEPVGRNTAAAIALAALHVRRADPGAVMVVLPADHYVRDAAALREALQRAARLAAHGPIVTLGIEPTAPETGYGYIERGARDARVDGAYAVARFCEKPQRELAEQFLASGNFDWNAGIFVMRPQVFEAEVERLLPELHRAMRRIEAAGEAQGAAAVEEEYPKLASVSVDFGVMEKAREVSVIPVSCGWSDVGSWSAMRGVLPADAQGNVVQGRAVLSDTEDAVIYASEGHVVGVVGLKNIVVVHTKEATLVAPADRAQDVRAIIEGLQQKGWTEYL